jgi:hypothetical protein
MNNFKSKQRKIEANSKLHRVLLRALIQKFKNCEINRKDFYEIKSYIDCKYGFCASSSKIILQAGF